MMDRNNRKCCRQEQGKKSLLKERTMGGVVKLLLMYSYTSYRIAISYYI